MINNDFTNVILIIFSTFCEDETPHNLESLVREDVVEGIVKLLWAIDPNFKEKITGYKLPVHAAQKFQVATLIANTVNSFGLKDPIGYHTLLYANVFEIRRIFLTLIEKLPKEKIWVEKNLCKPFNLCQLSFFIFYLQQILND